MTATPPLRPRHRLALVAALALGACSPRAEEPKAMTPNAQAFLKENDRAMAAMMSAMEGAPIGDPDKDFARMMIPHHQGAVAMAEALLKYGKNEELKALARNVVRTQNEEIALMRRVLGDTPQSAPKAGGSVAHGHHAM